jgi:hypothetical protein
MACRAQGISTRLAHQWYFLKGVGIEMDDNQTFQAWWDQWVVVLDRVRTEPPKSSSELSHDDWEPSRPDSTRWISYIM